MYSVAVERGPNINIILISKIILIFGPQSTASEYMGISQSTQSTTVYAHSTPRTLPKKDAFSCILHCLLTLFERFLPAHISRKRSNRVKTERQMQENAAFFGRVPGVECA